MIGFALPGRAELQSRTVVLADRTEVPLRIHAARGELLVLWLPSGYSRPEAHDRTAAELARRGLEVWQADLLEGRFLAPLESSLEQVPPGDVAELIEVAHRRTGKRVVLLAAARAALLALAGAQEWQRRQPAAEALAGLLLLHPNLFLGPPEPGGDAVFHPIVGRTRLPVRILQPALSPWSWRLEATVAELRKGGARVEGRTLPGVRDRFDTRADADGRERAEAGNLPALMEAATRELARQAAAADAAAPAPVTASTPTEKPRARGLKPYTGDPVPPPLALERLDGGRTDLADLRGRVVLVNFWASWCPPCVHEMPSMQRLKQKLAGRPFTVLAVNMGEGKDEIQAFLRRLTVDFPILLDRDGQALKRWKVFVFPTSLVLDRHGRIRYGVFGEVEWDAPEVLHLLDGLMTEG